MRYPPVTRTEARSERWLRGLAVAALVAIVLAAPYGRAEAENLGPEYSFIVIGEGKLPPRFRRARDVRWAGPNSVFMTEVDQGTFEIPLGPLGVHLLASFADQPRAVRDSLEQSLQGLSDQSDQRSEQIRQILPGSNEPGGFFIHSRLAVSSSALVVASPVFGWFVQARSEALPVVSGERALEFTSDLDVREDHVLVLGARKEGKQFVPTGFIAWEGPLANAPDKLKPLIFSVDGPGAASMNDCAFMDLGAVRYLPDGSFVVVPGVQPGIFWYGPHGLLQRTWRSEDLGFFTGCGLAREVASKLKMDPNARMFWVNARITLDEILPFPEGPGLVLRRWGPDGVSWTLKILHRDGTVVETELPVQARSRFARLRGDVRANQVVLLKLEYGEQFLDEPPRLIVLERR